MGLVENAVQGIKVQAKLLARSANVPIENPGPMGSALLRKL